MKYVRYMFLRTIICWLAMGLAYVLLLTLREHGVSAEVRGIWTGAVGCALSTLGWEVLDQRTGRKKKSS